MELRRGAINTALAGAALIIAAIIVASSGSEVSFGTFGYEPLPVVALGVQGVWAVGIAVLGVIAVVAAFAWTLGFNARPTGPRTEGE